MKEKILAEQDHKNVKGVSAKTINESCLEYYKTKFKLGDLISRRRNK